MIPHFTIIRSINWAASRLFQLDSIIFISIRISMRIELHPAPLPIKVWSRRVNSARTTFETWLLAEGATAEINGSLRLWLHQVKHCLAVSSRFDVLMNEFHQFHLQIIDVLLDFTFDNEANSVIDHGFDETYQALTHVFLHEAAIVALTLGCVSFEPSILRFLLHTIWFI